MTLSNGGPDGGGKVEDAKFDEMLECCPIATAATVEAERGSHRIWASPSGQILSIQPRKDGKKNLYRSPRSTLDKIG